MIVVPFRRACLKKVEATGWFAVELPAMTRATPASLSSPKVVGTAPDPIPSNSAATLEAWQSRVQWSTLLVWNPVRISFWKREGSSLEDFAEPKPAVLGGPPAR